MRRYLDNGISGGFLTVALSIVLIVSACTQVSDTDDAAEGASFLDQLQPGKVLHEYVLNWYGYSDRISDCLVVDVPETRDVGFNILVTVTSPVAGSNGEYEIHAEVE